MPAGRRDLPGGGRASSVDAAFRRARVWRGAQARMSEKRSAVGAGGGRGGRGVGTSVGSFRCASYFKRNGLLFYRAFLSNIHGGNSENVACPLPLFPGGAAPHLPFFKQTSANAEFPQFGADRGLADERRSVSACQRVPAATVGHFESTHGNRDHCRASPRLGPLT